MSDPLSTERRYYYPADHSSGKRTAVIAYIVLHDGEVAGGTGGDEAIGSWFDNPASSGSAHKATDDDSTQVFLDDTIQAWGAPPLNNSGLHLEQGGFASWSRATWLTHEAMIERSGYVIAQWMKTYGIPNVFMDSAALAKAGQSPAKPQGWTTHNEVSSAFHQSTHTDPGDGYPIDILQGYIDQYLDGGGDDVALTAAQAYDLSYIGGHRLYVAHQGDKTAANYDGFDGPGKQGWDDQAAQEQERADIAAIKAKLGV